MHSWQSFPLSFYFMFSCKIVKASSYAQFFSSTPSVQAIQLHKYKCFRHMIFYFFIFCLFCQYFEISAQNSSLKLHQEPSCSSQHLWLFSCCKAQVLIPYIKTDYALMCLSILKCLWRADILGLLCRGHFRVSTMLCPQ